jgi:hypothetical protein
VPELDDEVGERRGDCGVGLTIDEEPNDGACAGLTCR